MKKTTIALLIAIIGLQAQAQCDISPEDFEHSMTVTAVVSIGGVESTDENDIVYAYIDDECRGSVSLVHHAGLDRYFAYLTIFSNVPHGEPITFKVLDASSGETVTAMRTIDFHSGANYGVISNPHTIFDEEPPPSIVLSNSTIEEGRPIGTEIGRLSILPPPPDQTVIPIFAFASGDGDTDNGSFRIEDDKLLSAEKFNFDQKNEYSIRIRTGPANETIETQLTVQIMESTESDEVITVPVLVYDTVHVQVVVIDTVLIQHKVEIFEIDEIITSVNFPSGTVQMSIYPNPAQDHLQIDASSDIEQVNIYNGSGRIMSSLYPYSNHASISLSGYQTGIYFLKLFTPEGEINRKFVVSK